MLLVNHVKCKLSVVHGEGGGYIEGRIVVNLLTDWVIANTSMPCGTSRPRIDGSTKGSAPRF
jgi:hypothetical protein